MSRMTSFGLRCRAWLISSLRARSAPKPSRRTLGDTNERRGWPARAHTLQHLRLSCYELGPELLEQDCDDDGDLVASKVHPSALVRPATEAHVVPSTRPFAAFETSGVEVRGV